jgi:hypothetical protein
MPEKGAKNMQNGSAATAEAQPPKHQASVRKQPFARSRVGNGKALLAGVDQRTLAYWEYQDMVTDLVSHMGGERLTFNERSSSWADRVGGIPKHRS